MSRFHFEVFPKGPCLGDPEVNGGGGMSTSVLWLKETSRSKRRRCPVT